MKRPMVLGTHYPYAADFLAAVESFWGANGTYVPDDADERIQGRVTFAACPACMSKAIRGSDSERYPILVFDGSGGWGVAFRCRCDERAVLDALESSGEVSDAVAAIRKALLENSLDPRDSEGSAREEVPGTDGLLHRGIPAIFYGDHGEGKTWAVLLACMAAADAGERIVYFDYENTAPLLRENVEDILDAHGREWPERFEVRCYPQLSQHWSPKEFAEALADFSIVVFDSLRAFMAALHLDENSTPDVSKFVDIFCTPLAQEGITVVVLDNVGHEEKGRPRGANAKFDAFPQGFGVRTASPFSSLELGAVEIECKRSRLGDFGRTWAMPIGGGKYEAPHARTESPTAQRARRAHEGREEFLRACLAVLGERAPLGRNSLMKAVREKGIKGRDGMMRDWLSELAADPTSGLASDPQEGYSLAKGGDGPNGAAHPRPIPSEGAMGPSPYRGVASKAGPTPGPGEPDHPLTAVSDPCADSAACEEQVRSTADGWICVRCGVSVPPRLGMERYRKAAA